MARPATTPVKLKDGFYIELRHKGDRSGIKLRRDNYEQIEMAIKKYERMYEVHFLGHIIKGKAYKQDGTPMKKK